MKKIDQMTVSALEEAIRRHNRLYFQLHKPEIPDYEFDQLVSRLKKMKPDSSALSEIPADFSVTKKEFKKIRHSSLMLSLDKCYAEKDLQDWASKFEGDVVASPKIDGCATEIRYNEKGEMILAVTRGDGAVGEDITPNAGMIADIPKKISVEGSKRGVEIRGEIYMKLSV
ncbi:MAG: hypothetical protein HY542_03060, partial [Deltaproteobacteria bacterium]|nr:hypothetical protein [Deltaproteobacteria bacterium]